MMPLRTILDSLLSEGAVFFRDNVLGNGTLSTVCGKVIAATYSARNHECAEHVRQAHSPPPEPPTPDQRGGTPPAGSYPSEDNTPPSEPDEGSFGDSGGGDSLFPDEPIPYGISEAELENAELRRRVAELEREVDGERKSSLRRECTYREVIRRVLETCGGRRIPVAHHQALVAAARMVGEPDLVRDEPSDAPAEKLENEELRQRVAALAEREFPATRFTHVPFSELIRLLDERVKALREEIDNLTYENGALAKQNEALRGEGSKLRERIAELENKNATFERDLERVALAYVRTAFECNEYQKAIADHECTAAIGERAAVFAPEGGAA